MTDKVEYIKGKMGYTSEPRYGQGRCLFCKRYMGLMYADEMGGYMGTKHRCRLMLDLLGFSENNMPGCEPENDIYNIEEEGSCSCFDGIEMEKASEKERLEAMLEQFDFYPDVQEKIRAMIERMAVTG